jgi:hypothetical protein
MQRMNHATDRAGESRYWAWTLRRYVGGTLATAGIFAVFFGVENLTGSRAVSLTLLIVGLVSVVFGLKLRGRSRSFSGKRHRASQPSLASPGKTSRSPLLAARAEVAGKRVYPLAYLNQAFRCEADRRERIAVYAIDNRVQDGVVRLRQASRAQFGDVDLTDLVATFASRPGARAASKASR